MNRGYILFSKTFPWIIDPLTSTQQRLLQYIMSSYHHGIPLENDSDQGRPFTVSICSLVNPFSHDSPTLETFQPTRAPVARSSIAVLEFFAIVFHLRSSLQGFGSGRWDGKCVFRPRAGAAAPGPPDQLQIQGLDPLSSMPEPAVDLRSPATQVCYLYVSLSGIITYNLYNLAEAYYQFQVENKPLVQIKRSE